MRPSSRSPLPFLPFPHFPTPSHSRDHLPLVPTLPPSLLRPSLSAPLVPTLALLRHSGTCTSSHRPRPGTSTRAAASSSPRLVRLDPPRPHCPHDAFHPLVLALLGPPRRNRTPRRRRPDAHPSCRLVDLVGRSASARRRRRHQDQPAPPRQRRTHAGGRLDRLWALSRASHLPRPGPPSSSSRPALTFSIFALLFSRPQAHLARARAKYVRGLENFELNTGESHFLAPSFVDPTLLPGGDSSAKTNDSLKRRAAWGDSNDASLDWAGDNAKLKKRAGGGDKVFGAGSSRLHGVPPPSSVSAGPIANRRALEKRAVYNPKVVYNPKSGTKSGAVALTDHDGTLYTGALSIGTPAKTFIIDFDTGCVPLSLPRRCRSPSRSFTLTLVPSSSQLVRPLGPFFDLHLGGVQPSHQVRPVRLDDEQRRRGQVAERHVRRRQLDDGRRLHRHGRHLRARRDQADVRRRDGPLERLCQRPVRRPHGHGLPVDLDARRLAPLPDARQPGQGRERQVLVPPRRLGLRAVPRRHELGPVQRRVDQGLPGRLAVVLAPCRQGQRRRLGGRLGRPVQRHHRHGHERHRRASLSLVLALPRRRRRR